jgi:hypothetical protein
LYNNPAAGDWEEEPPLYVFYPDEVDGRFTSFYLDEVFQKEYFGGSHFCATKYAIMLEPGDKACYEGHGFMNCFMIWPPIQVLAAEVVDVDMEDGRTEFFIYERRGIRLKDVFDIVADVVRSHKKYSPMSILYSGASGQEDYQEVNLRFTEVYKADFYGPWDGYEEDCREDVYIRVKYGTSGKTRWDSDYDSDYDSG